MKQQIANIITLISLCLGTISILESCNLNFVISSYLILICFLLDGLDGSLARFFNTNSKYGQQLDSLADMTAFGIAPGILMYNYISVNFNLEHAYVALSIPIFSALRLAYYNTYNNGRGSFKGLTTPVSALLFVSIPLIQEHETNKTILDLINNQYLIVGLVIVTSILLTMPFETFELRLDNLKNNKKKLFFIIFSVSILYIFKFTGLPIVILCYIILCITKYIN